MATVYKISKPLALSQYDLSLPCYFRRVFGPSWDIFYGLLSVMSFSLCTWYDLEKDFYLLLLNSYFDLIIFTDASMSLFIRFYQSIQVIAVNRYIEAFYIAAWSMLGFTLDLISCTPFLAVLFFIQVGNRTLVYQIICLLRFGRLYTTARRFLDKTLYEQVTDYEDEPFNDIGLSDFAKPAITLRKKISSKKMKKLAQHG